MNFKERHFFVQAGGIEARILGALEPFQALHCFGNCVHQNCAILGVHANKLGPTWVQMLPK